MKYSVEYLIREGLIKDRIVDAKICHGELERDFKLDLLGDVDAIVNHELIQFSEEYSLDGGTKVDLEYFVDFEDVEEPR